MSWVDHVYIKTFYFFDAFFEIICIVYQGVWFGFLLIRKQITTKKIFRVGNDS
jgi:hypothetical protein